MKDTEARHSFRSRIFRSFLLALLPIILILATVAEVFLVPYAKTQAIEELKNATGVLVKAIRASASIAIRNHLEAIAKRNLDIVKYHYSLVKQGEMSEFEAKKRLRDILLSQKIGTSGYIYCLNSDDVLVVHPKQILENKPPMQYDFAKQQIKLKHGYIEYNWKNPGEKHERAKALYMVYFEPFDWIISVSSYREEFSQLLNPNDFKETILSLRFGKSGYAYVFSTDGETLVHPKMTGVNVLADMDMPVTFIKEMIKKQSGQIEYLWTNPGENSARRKIAVYEILPEYNWIIVSSAYIDEIMGPVHTARWIAYCSILVLMITGGIVAYFASGRLILPIHEMIKTLDENSKQATNKPLPVIGSGEISRLAEEFNSFMQAIDKQNTEIDKERARYRNIFEASADAVILLKEITIVDCSPATCDIFDGAREEIIGKTIIELSSPEQYGGVNSSDKAASLSKLVSVNKFETFEWIHKTVKGRKFDAEVRLAVFDDTPEERLLIAFVRDITERKKAEAEIRQERDFSQALIDSSPAYIVILDCNNLIRLINPSFCNILGYSPEQAIGKKIFDLAVTSDDKGKMRAMVERVRRNRAEGKNATETGPASVLTNIDEERTIQWSMTCISNPVEVKESILAVGVDVTEEQSLQNQLHHVQKLEAIGRLAGGVAHDFNNMLGGIIGAAEIMEHGMEKDSPMMKYINLIISTVERAADLSKSLLSFSRKGKRASTPINVHPILNDAINILKSGLDQNVETVMQFQAESPVIVGDPSQLQNIFLNILINARDAMPEGGLLKVSTCNLVMDSAMCAASVFDLRPGTFLEIAISDTGCGMDRDTILKIFEPFFTTKREGKGTGLGLASAYGVVKDHRGEISVESEPGMGTTFTMRLPCSEEREASITSKSAITKGDGCVLLVDDDEVLRTTGEMTLTELGYEVIVACDGVDAVEKFRKNSGKIILTIMDMVMPRMDGRQTFHAIRKISPEAKIVIASGFSAKEAVTELEREGLAGFVHKPYRMAELSSVVAGVLGKRHRQSTTRPPTSPQNNQRNLFNQDLS